jgi:hypothetical protein
MKSHTRAWIMTGVLIFTWGMIGASPFVYFAEMLTGIFNWLLRKTGWPVQLQLILLYFIIAGLVCLLLILGRKKYRLYLAGFFALAILVHHLVQCLKTNRLYDISLPIVIVLALSLVFILIRKRKPGLWLADAFIMSLPAWLLYDGLMVLIFSVFDWKSNRWQPFFGGIASANVKALDGLLRMPWQLWVLIPAALAVVPILLFAKNRD